MSILDAILPNQETTILDILKEDHNKVREILDKADDLLSKYPNVQEKDELALMEKLIEELEPHAKAEEKIFYKALRDSSEESLNPYEGLEEHKLAMQVLKVLQDTDLNINERTAKIQVLKEMLLHHISEEESMYFKQAKSLFSEEQLVAMGKEFSVAKAKLKSQDK